MQLSETQKDDLLKELNSKMNLTLFDFELGKLLDIIGKYKNDSFSTIITEKGEVAKRCELGYLHVFPKKRFRQQHVAALRTLVKHFIEHNKGLTTAELSAMCSPLKGKHTQSSVAHFPELRFWNLIGGATGQKMNEIWVPILKTAVPFLENKLSVPVHVYTKKDEEGNVVLLPSDEWPEQCEKPVHTFCKSIEYQNENDPSKHVEESVAI